MPEEVPESAPQPSESTATPLNDGESTPGVEAPEEAIFPRWFGIGSSIKWDSPLKRIELMVELPFWLLMPAGTYTVEVDGARVQVTVDNAGIEMQHGHQFTLTHRTTVFMGNQERFDKETAPIHAALKGGLIRGTRTLLYLEAYAVSDALDAFFGPDGPRFQDGSRYMASLAVGQLAVVNALINGYRRAAVDPFAKEVTSWDLPVWFATEGERSQTVYCYSFLLHDWYPTHSEEYGSDKSQPIFATSQEAVTEQLSRKEIPGEIEMLNAWSLYHRGAYADSIRSFVTGVEVLLEAEMRRLLRLAGESDEAIENRLNETRSRFNLRLEEYCELTKRRVPGPILHDAAECSGVRLLYEFGQTRQLRHEIVHAGTRLDHNYSGLMQRAAETTSWLFDWLSDGGGFEERRRKNSTLLFSFMMTESMFDCDVHDEKVVVVKPHYVEGGKIPDDLLPGSMVFTESFLLRRIAPPSVEGRDIEHFSKLAFCEMGLGELEDSPYAPKDGPTVERFRIDWKGSTVGVYLLDVPNELALEHIDELAQSLPALGANEPLRTRAVFVVNHEMSKPWTERKPIDPQLDAHAKSLGISVVGTPEIAKLVIASTKYRWAYRAMAEAILDRHDMKTAPPSSRLLGEVIQFWPKAGIVGIRPVAGGQLAVGDMLAIDNGKRYEQQEALEVRVDEAGLISVKIGPEVTKLAPGKRVFVLDKEKSFGPPEEPMTNFEFPPGTAYAMGFVHPSRVV